MNIKIRKADIYDMQMISVIGKISAHNAFANVFDQNNLDEYLKKAYDPCRIAASFKRENNIYWIAEMDNRPIGFAKVRKFSLNDEIESGAQMQLEKIYVLPEYQNNGAGTVLLKEVMNFANEYCPDYLWLDVYAGNEKAIHFYERNGFKRGNTYHQGFGAQLFKFHMMMLPVHIDETLCC